MQLIIETVEEKVSALKSSNKYIQEDINQNRRQQAQNQWKIDQLNRELAELKKSVPEPQTIANFARNKF